MRVARIRWVLRALVLVVLTLMFTMVTERRVFQYFSSGDWDFISLLLLSLVVVLWGLWVYEDRKERELWYYRKKSQIVDDLRGRIRFIIKDIQGPLEGWAVNESRRYVSVLDERSRQYLQSAVDELKRFEGRVTKNIPG